MRARVFLAVVLAALAIPGVAQAKGPDQATIDGAGMAAPISVAGREGGDDDLGTLVELTGLFPAVFGQSPDPMLAAAPKEALGPKLVITWRLPDGGPTPGTVRQDLYLYADGGPLTHTESGQLFGSNRTTGGWFRTPAADRSRWSALELPTRTALEAPARPAASTPVTTSDPGAGGGWLWPVVSAIAVAVLVALALTASRITSGRRVRVGSA